MAQCTVECLTRDRGVAGSSLTGCIVFFEQVTLSSVLSKTLYPLLSTGSTKEDLSQHDKTVLTGTQKSKLHVTNK